ncbi:hypothetical protein DFH07DRAFT_34918 [Mycena maculata]|uniref:Uncharacterized protein n=1 Tax=Mycena maculata TaxID=230809 RepID=A0AAD7IIR0_9AGAR|nr:hypothetical protein DFH07DRAFT_34918 [Mycena maculata]
MAAQTRLTWDRIYEALRVTLWPVDGGPVEGESVRGEPPALRDRIETLTPDDGWLTHSRKKSDSDAMDVDDSDGEGEDPNDGEDVGEGPASIRYINLEAHPALAIDELRLEVNQHHNKATFVVRHEYNLFMEHAMSRVSDPPDDSYRARFFLTGQPGGIGKSFAFYYFLFRLLALGQSVFFFNSPTTVYYFSRDGVQRIDEIQPATVDALEVSWALIDTDDKSGWVPPKIFKHVRCVVCTSSPRESLMREFLKRFGAETWYMRAWSPREIAAITERLGLDRANLLKRLNTGGRSHEAYGAAYLSPRPRPSMPPSRMLSAATYSLSRPWTPASRVPSPFIDFGPGAGPPREGTRAADRRAQHIHHTLSGRDAIRGLDASRAHPRHAASGRFRRRHRRGDPQAHRQSRVLRLRNRHDRPRQRTSTVPPAGILQLCRRGRHPRDAQEPRPHPSFPGRFASQGLWNDASNRVQTPTRGEGRRERPRGSDILPRWHRSRAC